MQVTEHSGTRASSTFHEVDKIFSAYNVNDLHEKIIQIFGQLETIFKINW